MDPTSAEQASSPAVISPAGSINLWLGVFNRVFSRHLMNIVILMTLPVIFAPSFNRARTLLSDADLWWHLTDARMLIISHHFIRVEPYSFTVAGHAWLDPEWLAELPWWFSYQSFSFRGIYVVAWLALGANILFVYWRGCQKARHAGAAFWAAGLGFFLMTANAGPRTIAFAYLAMSAEFAILEAADQSRKALVWLLPPIFCLWINLHTSWFIGFGLLLAYIVCGLFRVQLGAFVQDPFDAAYRNRMLAVLAVSMAALFVNPYGWRLVWTPIDYMLNLKLSVAFGDEWQPLNISSPRGVVFLIFIGLMVLSNCIRGRKWTLFEMATVFLASYSACAHTRFTYMAAILLTPMLAADIQRAFCTEDDEKTIPIMNALIVSGAVATMVFTFPSESELRAVLAQKFPLQIIASIQPSWRTLNTDWVGSMLDFESKPSFMDSRADTFEHYGVIRDFLSIAALQDPLRLMSKYRVDHVLMDKDAPLTHLLEQTPGWRVVRQEGNGDGAYELLVHVQDAGTNAESNCVHIGKGI